MQSLVSRLAVAIVLASVVTLLVFWMMQTLISSGKSALPESDYGRLIEFVDMSQDDDLQTKQRKPKKPPTPPQEPPKPDMPKPSMDNPANSNSMDISGVDMSADLQVDSGLSSSSVSDGEYLPIVKVAPQYPRRAAQRGIEGYVILEFTVTKLGTVINPVVIEAKPANVFDRSAMSAALKFKYKPKIVDGVAQEVTGVRNIIRFQLEKK
jgi:protein TonB